MADNHVVNAKPIISSLIALSLAACAPAAGPTPDATLTAPAPRLPGMTESRYVTLEGERVYFEVGGPLAGNAGVPVVFVHGIGAGNSSHLWRENTAAMAKDHRVYAFDWPGFARSGARPIQYTNDLYVGVLKAFIRDVVREPVALVAGSLGSDYAIRVSAENPELVTRLIVSNPSGYDVNEPENKDGRTLLTTTSKRNQELYDRFAKTFLGDVIFSTLKADSGLNFFLYNYVYLDWRRVTPELTAIYQGNLDGPNKQYAPFSFFSGFLEQRVGDFWPKLKQPTLLVWGSDDIFTPIRFADDFLKARSDVKLEVLRARAIPYDEDADRFNQIATAFLKP
jgi:pimeloyl-ACP methyl ester carboxylesterase